jgi:SAM-dependent methyltransferase
VPPEARADAQREAVERVSERARWDAKYAAGEHAGLAPSSWLAEVAARLPGRGRALDVAGGAGRHALWLARRGLRVTLVDVSEVGLGLARERATAAGLMLETRAADLDSEPLPSGPFDVVVCAHYLQRSLFAAMALALGERGVLVVAVPTVRNLERHARPSRRFLLEEGELERLVPSRLAIERYEEGWVREGFHEARLLARLALP